MPSLSTFPPFPLLTMYFLEEKETWFRASGHPFNGFLTVQGLGKRCRQFPFHARST